MDKQLDREIESLENAAHYFFMEGFRYAKNHPEASMVEADQFMYEVICQDRKRRNLISTARTDVGHKVTEHSTTPREFS